MKITMLCLLLEIQIKFLLMLREKDREVMINLQKKKEDRLKPSLLMKMKKNSRKFPRKTSLN